MVEQENSRNYGGILGDEMGLGKTIQTIATMCKQPSKDPQEKTNLIVAPVALLEQWKVRPGSALDVRLLGARHSPTRSPNLQDEIEEKCVDNQFKILVYHGKGKEGIKKVKHLQKYDVVSHSALPPVRAEADPRLTAGPHLLPHARARMARRGGRRQEGQEAGQEAGRQPRRGRLPVDQGLGHSPQDGLVPRHSRRGPYVGLRRLRSRGSH